MSLAPGRYAHCLEDDGYTILDEDDPHCENCMMDEDEQ